MLPGCVYRPDIQQGNLLLTSDVDQVKAGMTRSQVRYILGTPMVSDPFDQQRWDYIYTFRRGRDRDVTRAHFIVRFDGDKVSSVEKPDLPEETETSKIIKQQRERQAASAAKVNAAAAAAAAAGDRCARRRRSASSRPAGRQHRRASGGPAARRLIRGLSRPALPAGRLRSASSFPGSKPSPRLARVGREPPVDLDAIPWAQHLGLLHDPTVDAQVQPAPGKLREDFQQP